MYRRGVLCMPDKFNKVEYNNTYNKDTYDRITVLVKKADCIKSRLETLAISTNKSKNQLITEAIERLLQDNYL